MMTSSNMSMHHCNYSFCLDMEFFFNLMTDSLLCFKGKYLVFSKVFIVCFHFETRDNRAELTSLQCISILVLMVKISFLFSLLRQTLEVPNLHNKDIKTFQVLWFLDLLVMLCCSDRVSPTKNAELISIMKQKWLQICHSFIEPAKNLYLKLVH